MAVTNFIWDEVSDNVLFETDENGVVTASYTNRPERFGKLISQERNGVTSYYHYDGEYSTRQLTDENQTVTDTFIYSAFGEEVARTGVTTNPFGYKGEVGYYTNSATGDIYVRARTYQPTSGRWLSKDPIGFFDGPNLYRSYFVPQFSDPSGFACICNSSDHDNPLELNSEIVNPFAAPTKCCADLNACNCQKDPKQPDFLNPAKGIVKFAGCIKLWGDAWDDPADGYACKCCAWEQWVRGHKNIILANGTVVPLGGRPIDPKTYRQDSPRLVGKPCHMEATDRPGDSMPQGTLDELVKNGATIDVLLEFELRLINVCVNPEVVISTITYSWKLTGTFGGKLVTDCTLPAC